MPEPFPGASQAIVTEPPDLLRMGRSAAAGIDTMVETPSLLPSMGLPMVDDQNGAAFNDQNIPDAWWYAPDFEIVPPDPTSTPDASPFVFSFRTAGHDAENRPGIDATVTVTLCSILPEQARVVAGEAADTAVAVPLTSLGFSLLVPYRDGDGAAATFTVAATSVDTVGDTSTVTFAVRDGFARAAYGALSTPGYQQAPARVQVDYTFAGISGILGGPRPRWPHRPGPRPLPPRRRSGRSRPRTPRASRTTRSPPSRWWRGRAGSSVPSGNSVPPGSSVPSGRPSSRG
jgi:hypothetical protein